MLGPIVDYYAREGDDPRDGIRPMDQVDGGTEVCQGWKGLEKLCDGIVPEGPHAHHAEDRDQHGVERLACSPDDARQDLGAGEDPVEGGVNQDFAVAIFNDAGILGKKSHEGAAKDQEDDAHGYRKAHAQKGRRSCALLESVNLLSPNILPRKGCGGHHEGVEAHHHKAVIAVGGGNTRNGFMAKAIDPRLNQDVGKGDKGGLNPGW